MNATAENGPMGWLPSTKLRYAVLAFCLLAALAVLDALSRAVQDFGGAGLAILAWACFGLVLGWLLIEPMIMKLMIVGRVETGEQLDALRRHARTISAAAGVRTPDICLYEHGDFNAVTLGIGQRATLFVSTRLAGLPAGVVRSVIAHELGHVQLKHPLARLALFGSLLALAMLSSGLPLVALAANLFVLWCFRQMEFRADAAAATLAGVGEVRNALIAAQTIIGEGSRWLTFLSTHPPFAQRIDRLNRQE